MNYSECCYAPFTHPGWPDSDMCSDCFEHSGAVYEDDGDILASNCGVEYYSYVMRKKDRFGIDVVKPVRTEWLSCNDWIDYDMDVHL